MVAGPIVPMKYCIPKLNIKVLTAIIFIIAVILRIALSVVNDSANDDHISVIKIIQNEKRLPTKNEAWEGFQPKLYHVVAAAVFNIVSLKEQKYQIRLAQFLNCIAGIITICIVWLFLNNLQVTDRVKFISFSLVALNPKLIGINAQATNDSFVIMFSTATLYLIYCFFKQKKSKYFIGLTICSIFAGLSKGNGLVLFFGILLVFILKLIAEKKFLLHSNNYLPQIAIFSFIYLLIVPVCGQYYYNYREFGSPFTINLNKEPFPHFFQKTYHSRPGVTSIASSYFTFRIIDMVKHPTITNDNLNYPLYSTSLWSQLYGSTHFIFFDLWPLRWQTNNTKILNIGRATLIVALIPTFILLLEIFKVICRRTINIVRADFKFVAEENDWIFDIFLFGYILFILSYTLTYRDSGTMKAIFIFPALLSVIHLFSKGFDRICKQYAKSILVLDLFFGILFILYLLNISFLIFHLLLKISG